MRLNGSCAELGAEFPLGDTYGPMRSLARAMLNCYFALIAFSVAPGRVAAGSLLGPSFVAHART